MTTAWRSLPRWPPKDSATAYRQNRNSHSDKSRMFDDAGLAVLLLNRRCPKEQHSEFRQAGIFRGYADSQSNKIVNAMLDRIQIVTNRSIGRLTAYYDALEFII